MENALNNRGRRNAAFREILGTKKYEERRAGLEKADAVREAARFIKEMREHAKLSQAALARKLGMSQARVSEMERGNSPDGVGYALLRRVAVACGFPNWPMAPVESLRIQSTDQLPVAIVSMVNKGRAEKMLVAAGAKRIHRSEFQIEVTWEYDTKKSSNNRADEFRLIRDAINESPMLKVID
jgi:transcriptional regulator with XRE-family HTH domain